MVQEDILNFAKKYWREISIVVLLLAFVCMSVLAFGIYQISTDIQSKLDDANRVITSKIEEIQEFDQKLGIAESELRREEDLAVKYKDEIESFKKELKTKSDKIKTQDLVIKSRDETIAILNGVIGPGGGSTSTTVVGNTNVSAVCGGEVIAYQWSDKNKRFSLSDPDIAISDNEEFTYRQLIRVKGVVVSDKEGNVQIKKVSAEEVLERTDENGNAVFETIPDSNLKLVSSQFEYTNELKEKKGFRVFDPITLRPVVGFDTALTPSVGIEVANIGRWLPYVNIGLVPKIAFDVSDPLNGSLQNSRVGVGLIYHLAPPFIDTNVGIGMSLSTPFNNVGQMVLTVDATFYLTPDLFNF